MARLLGCTAAVVLLVCVLPVASAAWADEKPKQPEKKVPPKKSLPKKDYKTARAELDAAVKGGSAETIDTAVKILLNSVAASKDTKHAKDARKALKRLLRSKNEAIVATGLAGYGILARRGTSRDLKRFVLKKASKKKIPALRMLAIESWARIKDPGSHEALLAYIKLPSTDKQMGELAVCSARAMRHYAGGTKKLRYAAVDDFMKAYDMVQSAGIGAFMPSALGAAWWDRLKAPMLESCQLLTEEKFENYTEASTWWRKTRKQWR